MIDLEGCTLSDLQAFNLEGNPSLSILHFDNDKDWSELRKKGIGGSDIGAIMGLNKYTSALDIYKQKVDNIKTDLSDNVYVKKGKDLEDLILQKYVRPMLDKDGYIVHKPNFMIINNNIPYLRANVDGIAFKPNTDYKDNLIIEIKWVSEYAQVNWDGSEYGGIPASYYAQVQHYMAVTGCKKALVCALFDSDWTLHTYEINRDEMFILQLKSVAKIFYEYNMNLHIPPKLDISLDKKEVIEIAKTPAPASFKYSPEMSDLVEKYKDISSEIKKLENEKTGISNKLLDMYKQGVRPDNDSTVKLSGIKKVTFNTSKFKKDNPDMYEQYLEESEYTKFTIK